MQRIEAQAKWFNETSDAFDKVFFGFVMGFGLGGAVIAYIVLKPYFS